MRVLVVEDDEVLRDALKMGLPLQGITVDTVGSVKEASTIDQKSYAAAVLDITLPDGSGLDLLKRWRAQQVALPVLPLRARNQVTDRIVGLDCGAADYLGKPFDLNELAARLRALDRRAAGLSDAIITWKELRRDLNKRSVSPRGCEVPLSRCEFAIPQALYERPGNILSRVQLEERVYGWEEVG